MKSQIRIKLTRKWFKNTSSINSITNTFGRLRRTVEKKYYSNLPESHGFRQTTLRPTWFRKRIGVLRPGHPPRNLNTNAWIKSLKEDPSQMWKFFSIHNMYNNFLNYLRQLVLAKVRARSGPTVIRDFRAPPLKRSLIVILDQKFQLNYVSKK